jgi:hypothetical protein
MRSEHVILEIQAYCDGELDGIRKFRVGRHLDTCESCRDEYVAIRSLNATLRLGDPVDTGAGVLSGRRNRQRLRWVVTAAMVAVIAAVTLMAPHRHHYSDQNAAIAAALDGIETWHFSGWKQIDGKHVPWDIWGRRSPYLFYEKIGDDITVSDGATTRRIMAAAPTLGRPAGMVISTSVDKPTDLTSALQLALRNSIEPSVQTMVNGWDWHRGGGMSATQPYRQSPTEISYARQESAGFYGVNNDKVYTISKRTWLPVRYEFNNKSGKGAWDTEYLTAHYDVDLPRDVLKPATPPGYSVTDFTGGKLKPLRRDTQTYDIGPFGVHAAVVAMDTGGTALVKITTLLDRIPMDRSATSTFTAQESDDTPPVGEAGNMRIPYTNATSMFLASYDFITPGDDLPSGKLPDRLQYVIPISISMSTRDSDAVDEAGRVVPRNGSTTLFQTSLTMTLPVGKSTIVKDIRPYLPADVLRPIESRSNLERSIYGARASDHYMSSRYEYQFYLRYRKEFGGFVVQPDGILDLEHSKKPLQFAVLERVLKKYAKGHEALHRAELMRSMYWQRRSLAAVDELPAKMRTDAAADDYRMLAFYAQKAGEKAALMDALRKQLTLFKHEYPSNSTLVRQVEYEMKTGILVDDPDYKGPS